MFEIAIEAEFCAAHSLVIAGEREPVHGHNWRVTAVVAGPELDGDGLLVDFHAAQKALGKILAPWNNGNLNKIPPFDTVNPSAEHVAKEIALRLADRLGPVLVNGARVDSVTVTEAPGCKAVFRMGDGRGF